MKLTLFALSYYYNTSRVRMIVHESMRNSMDLAAQSAFSLAEPQIEPKCEKHTHCGEEKDRA